jgi:hypothetical protein
MNVKSSPTVKTFLPAAIIMMILGWGGIAAIISYLEPDAGMRWLLFFVVTVALTGTTLPFVAFLNRRFPSLPAPTPSVIVRQALWVGIYIATLIWLQSGRVFSWELALLLGVGLVLIESLLRLRERARWKPE